MARGIPPKNLIRVFAHGFTTKANGHGFGLHGSGLAAREAGGNITVQSAGVGKGQPSPSNCHSPLGNWMTSLRPNHGTVPARQRCEG